MTSAKQSQGSWRQQAISMILLCSMGCASCTPTCNTFHPHISATPNVCAIRSLPEGFAELDEKELFSLWGKELLIGQEFLKENDLYRSITALKRAKFLLPPGKKIDRRQQIDYSILLAYYLGGKYKEVTEQFEDSSLFVADAEEFPLYDDLLVMLYDAYHRSGKCEKASAILEMIRERNPERAVSLELYTTLSEGEILRSYELAEALPNGEPVVDYLAAFEYCKKSVTKARTLNAILPGAGYYYVGQKKTAVTSLLINALFIGAAWAFFNNRNVPAALITLSFEAGWYFGGINGAGLAAQEYNERLYEANTKEMMYQNKLFPIFYFSKSF